MQSSLARCAHLASFCSYLLLMLSTWLFETGSLTEHVAQPCWPTGWPARPWICTSTPTSPMAGGQMKFRAHLRWVLGTQVQVLPQAQPALYPRSHLLSPGGGDCQFSSLISAMTIVPLQCSGQTPRVPVRQLTFSCSLGLSW